MSCNITLICTDTNDDTIVFEIEDEVFTMEDPFYRDRKDTYPIQYIQNETNCFIAISHCLDKDGYPRINRMGKDWRMSRWVYYLHNGDITDGKVIMHLCNNRQCINPDHLKEGTQRENIEQMIQERRHLVGRRKKPALANNKPPIKLERNYKQNINSEIK